jgi:hypothetical protein
MAMKRAEAQGVIEKTIGAQAGKADAPLVIDTPDGLASVVGWPASDAANGAGKADHPVEDVSGLGLPSRYIDPETELLGQLAATWQDFAQTRKAAAQRQMPEVVVDRFQTMETWLGEQLKKALRQHPLWPWLSQFPGLGGVHTARLIARIGDPRRFPGQQCDRGHTFTPRDAVSPTSTMACPFVDMATGEVCPGRVLPPRLGTGTRSLWHYLGLHVVDGRSPRKTKGQRADWDPIGRTAVLQPDGIAEAIVRNRVPIYRERYDREKTRLTAERGVEVASEIDHPHGPRSSEVDAESERAAGGVEADVAAVSVPSLGLRPFQLDALARKIAVKAFVGDLLAEWKRLVGVDIPDAIEAERGSDEAAA